jgi:hypothetical protein
VQNFALNADDTQSCLGTDVGNIHDVLIGEFGTAKLRLEADGLFMLIKFTKHL